MQQFKRYKFCANRKCPHTECLRHITNAEYNIAIIRREFDCTEKNKFKDMLLSRPEKDEIGNNDKTNNDKPKRKQRSDAGKSRKVK